MDANIVIREIVEEDAAAYNAYRRRIADEPQNTILHAAGEYTRTVDEERQILMAVTASANQKIYVAVHDHRVIGKCVCRGGTIFATRHVIELGLDVDRDYRGQRIGATLLGRMIDWAGQHPDIRRIELTVFAHNRRAINLYLKSGFVIEGLAQAAYFKDGQYIDAYHMALLFRTKPEQPVTRHD